MRGGGGMARREGIRELRGDAWSLPKREVKKRKETDEVLGDEGWWCTGRCMETISGETRGGEWKGMWWKAERKRGGAEIGIEEWWDENAFGQKKKGMGRCLVCEECGGGGRKEGKWWTAVIGLRDGGEASDGWREEWLKAKGVWCSRTLED